MLTYEEAAELWGADQIVRLTPEQVDGLRLPESSCRFLLEVGLPREAAPELVFDLDQDGVAVLSHYASEIVAEPPDEWNSAYQIGRDPLGDLCLDGNRGGIVIHIDLERPDRERYVNANIELFGEFIYRWNQSEDELEREALRRWLEAFESDLRIRDPEAVRDPEGWWSVIIEDAINLGS